MTNYVQKTFTFSSETMKAGKQWNNIFNMLNKQINKQKTVILAASKNTF